MGCKLICGEKAPGRASIPTPVHTGDLYRDFSTFLFFVSRDNWEYSGGGRGGGYRFCVHLSPPLMLSQCFFSLSFELVLQHLTLRAGPSHVGGVSRKKTGRPARTRLQRGTSQPHLLPRLPLHRLLLPSYWGLSVWGEGSCLKTMPHLQSLTPEMPASTTNTARPAPHRTEDSQGLRGTMPAGLPRLTQVVLSCLRVPSSHCPNVSSDFFPFPPSSSFSLPAPWFNTGKTVTLPSSPLPSWITSSRHVSFSFLCVCV